MVGKRGFEGDAQVSDSSNLQHIMLETPELRTEAWTKVVSKVVSKASLGWACILLFPVPVSDYPSVAGSIKVPQDGRAVILETEC